MAIVDAAIWSCTFVPLSVANELNPLLNNLISLLFVTSIGHKNEFHPLIKLKIPIVNNAGFAKGINILLTNSKSEHPSTFAAL